MKGYIDGFDWLNVEAMKYWTPPSSWPSEKKKAEVKNAIFSGDYIGALKVDGYYQRILKDEDGNCFMIARSRNVKGEIVNKIEWLPHIAPWLDALPNGTCLLCECYLPGNESSKSVTSVLGCLKDKGIARQKTNPLHLYVFDVMAFAGENRHNWGYERRSKSVREMSQFYQSPYVEYAEFYEGEELWEKLQEYLASGREGCVIMRKDAIVYNKRTPAHISIKVKQELRQTIDCVIIGANAPTVDYTGKDPYNWQYWLNSVTGEKLEGHYFREAEQGGILKPVTKNYFYNWAGSLKLGLYKDGNLIYIGDVSGISDEIKENWRAYVGRVAEVGGMMITRDATGTAAIRHPKFLGWRNEKPAEECTYDQLDQ